MNDLSSLALLRGMPPQWRRGAPRRIGGFTVSPASNELARGGSVVRVRPRLMDVLLRLAAEPGVVIPRIRLLEEVWPRRMVSDEVLSRTIAELRMALGDDPRHPTYIETIPTVGYRLVATVDAIDAQAAPAAAFSAPGSAKDAAEPPLAALPSRASEPAPAPADVAVVLTPATRQHATPSTSHQSPLPAAGPRLRAATAMALHSLGGPLRHPAARRRYAQAGIALAVVAASAWFFVDRGGSDARSLATRIAGAAPFASDPGLEMEPRFAPDAQRIAYSASTAFASPAHLVVLDLTASGARREIVASSPEVSYRSPVFVGGSARLAYARCEAMHCRIVQRDLDTGAERVLVDDDDVPLPNFDISADGRYLVYASERRARYPTGLTLLDLSSGVSRELSAADAGGDDDGMPRFAPDGQRIAFFRGAGVMQQLWTMDRDGTHAAATSNARGAAYGAAWRDAQHLVVAADWFGFRALNEVDLATHTAQFVGARGARFPDVAPGGDIVYENAQFRADLWAFDAATATLAHEPAWPSTRFTMNPEYSPDGTRVVFVSNREGPEALFIASVDGTPVRLKLQDGYRYVNAHWSHDGRMLYSMRLGADPPHAMSAVRIDAQTGATEVLAGLGEDVSEMIPDRAGRYLYWAVGNGPVMRMMRAPLADLGAQQRLPFPGVDSFMLDTTHIAFTQPQIRGLTLCALATLACESLPLPISDSTAGAWTLGAGSVWYLDRSTAAPTLARYDESAKAVTLRSPAAPMPFGRTLAVAPDGTRVMLAREAPTLIDLMLAR